MTSKRPNAKGSPLYKLFRDVQTVPALRGRLTSTFWSERAERDARILSGVVKLFKKRYPDEEAYLPQAWCRVLLGGGRSTRYVTKVIDALIDDGTLAVVAPSNPEAGEATQYRYVEPSDRKPIALTTREKLRAKLELLHGRQRHRERLEDHERRTKERALERWMREQRQALIRKERERRAKTEPPFVALFREVRTHPELRAPLTSDFKTKTAKLDASVLAGVVKLFGERYPDTDPYLPQSLCSELLGEGRSQNYVGLVIRQLREDGTLVLVEPANVREGKAATYRYVEPRDRRPLSELTVREKLRMKLEAMRLASSNIVDLGAYRRRKALGA